MGRKRSEPEPRRYRIELTRAAERGLAALPKQVLRRMDAAIQALAEEPRPRGPRSSEAKTTSIASASATIGPSTGSTMIAWWCW